MKLTKVNAEPIPVVYSLTLSSWISEWTIGIESIKWGLIAAVIWFGLYQVATTIGVTPLF